MPNLPYKTAGWDTHAQSQLREIAYPLAEQEPTHYTVRRFYEGPNSTFGGTVALDTADAEFAAAKLVINGDRVPTDAGCIAYEHLFATVPASWSEPEEFAYTYPAYTGSGAYTASVAVTAITASGANYILSCSGGTIIAGDTVFYSLGYTRGGNTYFTNGTGLAVATTTAAQVTITRQLFGTGSFTGVSGTVAKVTTTRAGSTTLLVSSRVVSDYALTNAANIDADLPLVSPFQIIDNNGALTDTLSATTSPTAATYLGYVASGTELVAECTRRRYLGNIYVRRTRFVPAQ